MVTPVSRILTIVFLLYGWCHACGQAVDTVFVRKAILSVEKNYDSATAANSHLLNGTEYVESPRRGAGHPYFITEEFENGKIKYDDQLYLDAPLLFDLIKEKVITEHYPDGQKISLIPEKTDYFIIKGHKFTRIVATASNGLPRTGFYEVLFCGDACAFVLHVKRSIDRMSENTIETSVVAEDRYFIFKDGKFTRVKTKRSVLKIFHDRSSQIKQFIKVNNISFDDRDSAIGRITEYYDHLQSLK